MAPNPLTLALLTLVALDLGLALVALLRLNHSRGAGSLSGMLLAVALFHFGYAMEAMDPDPWRGNIWRTLQFLGMALLPVFFLCLTLLATHAHLFRHPLPRMLLAAPMLLVAKPWEWDWPMALAVENSWTDGVRLVAFGYLMFASIRLLTRSNSTQATHRIQNLLVVLAAAAPTLAFGAEIFTPLRPWSHDLMPLILAGTPIAFSLSVFGFQFLNFGTIPRELAFDGMQEAVILLDERLRIIDFNRSATQVFNRLDQAFLGEDISSLYPYAPGLHELIVDGGDHGLELPENTLGRTYEAHIQTLHHHEEPIGRMLRFNDVSRQVELRRALERLATTDPLTGALNRRTLYEAMTRELKRATRQQSPLAILFMDIDHFKRINDNHGHQVGDEVLRAFARTIQHSMRSTDIFGRYGGEEFLFVLTGTTVEQALQVAEKARRSIEQQQPSIGGETITFTTSIGVAVYDQFDNRVGSDDLINMADTALYQAKALGRNRVVCANA